MRRLSQPTCRGGGLVSTCERTASCCRNCYVACTPPEVNDLNPFVDRVVERIKVPEVVVLLSGSTSSSTSSVTSSSLVLALVPESRAGRYAVIPCQWEPWERASRVDQTLCDGV